MNSRDIIYGITRYLYKPHQLLVAYNTSSVTGHEADILFVSRSGYLNEIEIKISVADFKADFKGKPDKHEELLKGRAPIEFFDQSGKKRTDEGFDWNTSVWRKDWDCVAPHCVRHFWFAIPADLEEKICPLLPDYAGLIVVYEANMRAVIRKKAPVLKQSRKINDAERMRLLKSMYYRGWDLFNQRYRSGRIDECQKDK